MKCTVNGQTILLRKPGSCSDPIPCNADTKLLRLELFAGGSSRLVEPPSTRASACLPQHNWKDLTQYSPTMPALKRTLIACTPLLLPASAFVTQGGVASPTPHAFVTSPPRRTSAQLRELPPHLGCHHKADSDRRWRGSDPRPASRTASLLAKARVLERPVGWEHAEDELAHILPWDW